MPTFSKNDYLDAMGIQRWRVKTQPNISDEIFVLLNAQDETPRGFLLLASTDMGFEQPEVEKLLDAMLAAVHLKRGMLLEEKVVMDNQLQVIMGETLAQKILNSQLSLDELRIGNRDRMKNLTPVLVTYHPQMLLADVTLKRKAWEDLKIIMHTPLLALNR